MYEHRQLCPHNKKIVLLKSVGEWENKNKLAETQKTND